jgi:hypothetical protein
LFLLLFASTYVVMAAMSADNFGGRLTHTDGLYFTVTVFSTVGWRPGRALRGMSAAHFHLGGNGRRVMRVTCLRVSLER